MFLDFRMINNFPCNHYTYYICREVNEDNVLIRNILGEFEDSLKYVSKTSLA